MIRLLHDIRGDIAQPDPIAAPHDAARFPWPLPAHLGARFGVSIFFRARNRRPCKFFGGERHWSVLASTLCARLQMSTGTNPNAGWITPEPGEFSPVES